MPRSFSRAGRKEFIHFLNIAKGSLEEACYQLLLSKDLRFLAEGDFVHASAICEEVSKMLFSMKSKLNGPTA